MNVPQYAISRTNIGNNMAYPHYIRQTTAFVLILGIANYSGPAHVLPPIFNLSALHNNITYYSYMLHTIETAPRDETKFYNDIHEHQASTCSLLHFSPNQFNQTSLCKAITVTRAETACKAYECSDSTEGKLADIHIKINNIVDKAEL
jgi:hypothetical protein